MSDVRETIVGATIVIVVPGVLPMFGWQVSHHGVYGIEWEKAVLSVKRGFEKISQLFLVEQLMENRNKGISIITIEKHILLE